MTFRLFGCRITISPLFMGVVTLLLFIDTTGMMGYLLLSILLHEGGHLLFMGCFGCMPKAMELKLFEVNLVSNHQTIAWWRQGLISSAGVLVNLLVAAITGGEMRQVNLGLALFNCLPIFSMDGYQLLVLVCCRFCGLQRVPFVISVITVLLLGGVGIWLFFAGGNPLLLLFCLYMAFLQIREQRRS